MGELLKSNELTGGLVLDYTIDAIIRSAGANIFFAKSFVASKLKSNEGNSWNVIGRQFHCDRARRKLDGFYFLPIFTGLSIRSGHWYTIIFHLYQGNLDGRIFDSCPSL